MLYKKKCKFYFIPKLIIVVLFFNNFSVFSQKTNTPFKINGFVDFNGYYDTRNFSTLTYNILLQLSDRVQYFSLTNYDGASKSSELATNYAEHNLRFKVAKNSPLDYTLQYVLRNGEDNDDLKFGLRWRVSNTKGFSSFFKKLNVFYAINPMFIQFRNNTKTKYATQFEHVYNIKLFSKRLNNRLYLGGFADQIINYNDENISFTWVSEHQLGYRLYKQFFAVLEYRINQFRAQDKYGLGYGLEYKIKF